MKMPKSLKKYFWDSNFENLDLKKNAGYITSRILEYGDFKAAKWLMKNMERIVIKKVLLERRDLSLKSRLFWGRFLGIDSEVKKRWLKKHYQKIQKPVWNY